MGSYHMPRYAVRALDPKQPLKQLVIDFGVSHLESHPAVPADESGKAVGGKG